jgi:hypothetical protein
MIRACMKVALAVALLGTSTASFAARYIKINFTTNAAKYYGSDGFGDRIDYAQAWRGEVLIDTQSAYEGELFVDDGSLGGALITYSNQRFSIEQFQDPEGYGVYATFKPVALSSASFTSSLTSGTFSDSFNYGGRYDLFDRTQASLRSLTVTGFDSDQTLQSYATLRTFGPESAVPEPASWSLMIAGFGLVGMALRRRAASQANRLGLSA